MNSILSRLFGVQERAARVQKLRAEIISLRCSQTILAKKMSYLETRYPDIHAHLHKSDRPVATLRQADKDRIAVAVDKLLEGL